MSASVTASPFSIVYTLSIAIASGGWSSCSMSTAMSGMLSGGAETTIALARVSALNVEPSGTAGFEPLLSRGVDRDHAEQRREILGRGVGFRARALAAGRACNAGESVDAASASA